MTKKKTAKRAASKKKAAHPAHEHVSVLGSLIKSGMSAHPLLRDEALILVQLVKSLL